MAGGEKTMDGWTSRQHSAYPPDMNFHFARVIATHLRLDNTIPTTADAPFETRQPQATPPAPSPTPATTAPPATTITDPTPTANDTSNQQNKNVNKPMNVSNRSSAASGLICCDRAGPHFWLCVRVTTNHNGAGIRIVPSPPPLRQLIPELENKPWPKTGS
eukprot:3480730-Pleurochrysis_carterae.AAC.1